MKKIYSIIFFSIIYSGTNAQLSFVRNDSIPVTDQSVSLKLPWAGGLDYPMFNEIDLNGDGIMDLIVYESGDCPGTGRLMPFLNYGTYGQTDYRYAPEYISHFPDINGWLVTHDYNCDGKMDLFTIADSCGSCVEVFRNDYNTLEGLKFTRVAYPLNTQYGNSKSNIPTNSLSVPAFVDIDNDGDMDIINFGVGYNGMFEYQKNVAVDNGWSCDSLRFTNVSQCWGGFALAVNFNQVGIFGDACGMMESDAFDKGTARVDDGAVNSILVYDNDGDGLKDCLIGALNSNNALFVHNGGSSVIDSMDYQITDFPHYDIPVNLSFPSFFFLDVNNDSAKDLIVAPHEISNFRGILFYKNIGTTSHPVFQKQPGTFLQQDMIDVGSSSVPVLFDYNGDGLPDLVIGNQSYHDTSGVDHKGLTLYQNTGTASAPAFQLVTRDYLGLDTSSFTGTFYPTFGDLNGDGALDLIVGVSNGQLLYYVNTAPPQSPANFVLTSTFFGGIDAGNYSAPQLYDLNHDGILDLIIGNYRGMIQYYQNNGTPSIPSFSNHPSKDTLGGINIHCQGTIIGYASPFFYNDNGVDKLIIGAESGKIYVYDNINGNIYGNYHLTDSLVNREGGQNVVPYIGDINNDGHPDMLVGNSDGGIVLYMNSHTVTGISKLHGIVAPNFIVYPNPATDQLTISAASLRPNETITISIINVLGEILKEEKIKWSGNENISVKSIAAGIYFIELKSESSSVVRKFVKE